MNKFITAVFVSLGLLAGSAGPSHAYPAALQQKMLKAIEKAGTQWQQPVTGLVVLKMKAKKGYFYQEPTTGPKHLFGSYVKAAVLPQGQTTPVIAGGFVSDLAVLSQQGTPGTGFRFVQMGQNVLKQPRKAVSAAEAALFKTFMQ